MISKYEFKNQTRVKYIDFATYKKETHSGDWIKANRQS